MTVDREDFTPEPYDWERALGPLPDRRVPGQTSATHPLTIAIGDPDKDVAGLKRRKGVEVLSEALRRCQGRLDKLGEMLECSWHVAGRLVDKAGLRGLAGDLRYEHKHPGPTGHGIQRRRRPAAA
jgi:hypothetical protein